MSNLSSNSSDKEEIILSSSTRETRTFALTASDSEVYDATRRRPGGTNLERTPFLPRDREGQDHPGSQTRAASQEGDGPSETVPPGGEGPTQIRQDEPRLPRDEPTQIAEGPRYLWLMYVWATLVTLIYFGYHWAAFKLDSKGKVVANGSMADYIILVIIADVIMAAFLVYVLNYLMKKCRGWVQGRTTHPAPKRLNIMIRILIQTISNLGISAYLEMSGKSERRYDIIYFGLALSSFFTSLICYIYQEGYAEVIAMLSFLFNGLLVYVIAERAWWWLMLVIPLNCMAAAFNAWLLRPSSPPVSTSPS